MAAAAAGNDVKNTGATHLSKRALHTKSFDCFRYYYAGTVMRNPYHADTNPQGYIDLGTAENKLVEDVVHKRLLQPDCQQLERYMHYYFEFRGVKSFRQTIASFLHKRLHSRVALDPENIIVTSGAGAALDFLSYTLADAGECFLSPAPYYTGICSDMGERSQVEVVAVPLSCEDNYKLTADQLDATYRVLIAKGKTVKGLVLINPHNPLGTIYDREVLTEVLEWAKSLELHVIMDEIYAFSVWDETANFVSVTALEKIPDPERTHLVWGFSKDFSLSGFRTGVIYSWNPEVVALIKGLIYFAAVPAVVLHKLDCLLKDDDWLDSVFFPTSLTALRRSYHMVKEVLDRLEIPYIPPKAGLYVWINLSKYTKPLTAEGQTHLFKQIYATNVYIEPANAFYSEEFGWFRICFGYPEHWVKEGLKRIETTLVNLQ